MLIGVPILLLVIYELRKIMVLAAEKKADDGKIDAEEWLEIIEASLWGLTRLLGSVITKLKPIPTK